MDIELLLFDFGGVLAPEGFQLGILKLAQEFNVSFEEMYRIAGYKAGLESGYTAGKVGEGYAGIAAGGGCYEAGRGGDCSSTGEYDVAVYGVLFLYR